MERDEFGDMFRYRIGQCVRWADWPQRPHYVGQRRWTQRKVMAPVVEYKLFLSETGDSGYVAWVIEADVEVWAE